MKEFTENQRKKIWKKEFGKKTVSTDPFGSKVTKNNFDVDHILPKSKGGNTTISNAQILSHENNEMKWNKTSGVIRGKHFVVKTISKGVGKMIVNEKK